MILMKDKKLPLVSLLSTILIGGYTIVLLCVGIVTIFLGRYAGGLITAGMNLTANSVGNGDYISGYLMLPGFLSALLGGMTGAVAFLLAAGMFLLFLLFPILLISSIVMLKKRKIKADACVKIIIFFILSILSWLLLQSVRITLLLIIPAIMGLIVLIKKKGTDE